jgi:Zn-dependent protease
LKDALYILPILIFSVVVHEVAHGWTALRCGDTTARDAGRLTLNPIPHIDLFGSIIIPLLLVFSGSTFFLAWAKPVPVNPNNFYNYRRDDILVSFAGPLSNLVMGFVCCAAYVILSKVSPDPAAGTFSFFVMKMFVSGITLNVFLAIFNLIPVPPLDGSHILASFLPENIGDMYRRVGFVGVFLVLFLLQVPAFKTILFNIADIVLIPYRYFLDLFL